MTTTRRNIVRAGLGALVLGATGGVVWVASGPSRPEPGVADALALLDTLESSETVIAHGAWSVAKVFAHLAQSVEMSLEGYPEHKSAVFKRTAGSAALAVFRKRGRMSHALDEPIPGAPALDDRADAAAAMARLRDALIRFDGFSGPLAPHFAYGVLSHEQYAVAHVLHLRNHLQEISFN